jgi:DNA-binding transcriptional ArsR family regulator
MVTELAEPFAMALPSVSKHLKVLEAANLIARTIDGRIHYCALAPAPLKAADRWLEHYRVFWTGKLELLADYVESGRDKPPP